MEMAQQKYGNILIPTFLAFVALYLSSTFNKEDRPWFDYYFVSQIGMMAYHVGDYSFAKKCADQFLLLQPQAQANHNHAPLYSTGFALAALLALKAEDFTRMHDHINHLAQYPAESQFDFHNDVFLLIGLVREGHRELAVKYMETRAQSPEIKQEVQPLIEFVKNGGAPFSKEYFEIKTTSDSEDNNT
jgi:hypothetical protein